MTRTEPQPNRLAAHLQTLDDLYRKVQMDAMAIAPGVVPVAGAPYALLEAYDAAPFQANVFHLVVLISVTYLVSVVVGLQRYK